MNRETGLAVRWFPTGSDPSTSRAPRSSNSLPPRWTGRSVISAQAIQGRRKRQALTPSREAPKTRLGSRSGLGNYSEPSQPWTRSSTKLSLCCVGSHFKKRAKRRTADQRRSSSHRHHRRRKHLCTHYVCLHHACLPAEPCSLGCQPQAADDRTLQTSLRETVDFGLQAMGELRVNFYRRGRTP